MGAVRALRARFLACAKRNDVLYSYALGRRVCGARRNEIRSEEPISLTAAYGFITRLLITARNHNSFAINNEVIRCRFCVLGRCRGGTVVARIISRIDHVMR